MEQEAINRKHKVTKQPSGRRIQDSINDAKKLLSAPADEDTEYEERVLRKYNTEKKGKFESSYQRVKKSVSKCATVVLVLGKKETKTNTIKIKC
jgi:hypothetical protein